MLVQAAELQLGHGLFVRSRTHFVGEWAEEKGIQLDLSKVKDAQLSITRSRRNEEWEKEYKKIDREKE